MDSKDDKTRVLSRILENEILPVSRPSDIDWNVHMKEVMNFAIEGVTEMTIVMSVAKIEEEGFVNKLMPSFVLVPLQDGNVVRLRTLVSEHGLYQFYGMKQGVDVKTLREGYQVDIPHVYLTRAVFCPRGFCLV